MICIYVLLADVFHVRYLEVSGDSEIKFTYNYKYFRRVLIMVRKIYLTIVVAQITRKVLEFRFRCVIRQTTTYN